MKEKLLWILLIVTLLSGCNTEQSSDKTVTVSIEPVKMITDILTDSKVEVNVMIPAGSSHATYSPTTQQMKKFSDSDIYFQIGYLGYEKAFMHNLKDLNKDIIITNLSDEFDLIRGPEIVHGDHTHPGGIDPHIWMSPAIMLQMSKQIQMVLKDQYPELSERIESNYLTLQLEIKKLHKDLKAIEGTNKRFMIFHPALTYLARDYGFEQIPIEKDGKEPSPSQLKEIIESGKDIPVIFIQKEYDITSAELVAKETGAQIIQINPLNYNWIEEMQTIISIFNEKL